MDPTTTSISILVLGDNSLSASNAGLKNGTALVSATGQVVATIGSATPAGTIATNPGAAVVTAIKIGLDFQSGKPVQPGDVLAAIGDLFAIVGAIAFYIPGGQAVALGATIVGDLLNVGGLYLDRQSIGIALKSVYGDIVKNGSVPSDSADGATLQSFIADHNGKNSGAATVSASFNDDDTVGQIVSYDKSGNVVQTDSYTYTEDGTATVATVTENIYSSTGALLSTTVTYADQSSLTTAYNSTADSRLITVTSTDANGKITQVATTVADSTPNVYDTTVKDGSGNILLTRVSTYVNGVLSSQTENEASDGLSRQYSYQSGKLEQIQTYSSGTMVGLVGYAYDFQGDLDSIYVSGTGSIVTANNATINLANAPGGSLTLVGTGDTIVATKIGEPFRAYDSVFNLTAGDSVTIVTVGGDTINGDAGEAITLNSSSGTFINVSGDSASGMAADGQAAGITLTQGSEGIFSGSGNTIRAAANTFVIGATDDDIVLNGNGATVESGRGNRIVAANGTSLYINQEQNDTISGNNDTINFVDSSSLILLGTGDVVSGAGTLTLSAGTSVMLNGSGTINAGVGDAIAVEGAGNSVTINANGDAAGSNAIDGQPTGIALGRAVSATIVGTGDTVTAAGSNRITASHDDIALNGSGCSVAGTGNRITAIDNVTMTLSGANHQLDETIAGNGETITALGQGSLMLQGTGDFVTVSGSTMTLADAMSSLTVSGTGDTIVSKGGDVITIASGQAATGRASDTLNAAGPDTIMLGNNVDLSVDGSGQVITAAGNNDITGSGNAVSLTGAGSSITGDNNTIAGSNTTVDLSQSNDDTLSGNNDTILGNNETLTLTGTGNTVAARWTTVKLNAGATATVSGAYDTVYADAGSSVTIDPTVDGFSPTTTSIYASNDTTGIIVNKNARANIYGTGDSVTAQGSNNIAANGDTIDLAGSYTTIIGSNDVLQAADNLAFYFYGSNNVVDGNHESVSSSGGSFTLNGSGDSVVTSSSTVTANGVSLTLSGQQDTIVGENDVLTLGSGTTNLTIEGAGETVTLSDATITATSLKVSASANGNDLVLTNSATGMQEITFAGMLAAGNQGVTRLEFADGTVWTREQLLSMVRSTGTPTTQHTLAETSGVDLVETRVTQLIHAMATFSANHSGMDWTSPSHSLSADAMVLTAATHPWHQHRI